MKISVVEKQQLLTLYKEDTGNPSSDKLFRLSDYIEWLENKLLTLLNCKK